MLQRGIPVPILIAVAIGCSKKPNETPSGDSKGCSDIVEATDPSTAYTIKLRNPAKDDKTEIVKTRTASETSRTANSTQKREEKLRFEFVETVLDTSPDEPRPTKVSRAYKVAEQTDQNAELKSLSYAGKTVTIEKYLMGYKYMVDGKSMPVTEQIELNKEYTSNRENFDVMLPKAAVKVGEEWAVDLAAIKALSGNLPFPYHKDRSKITGKLLRAFTKKSQQWGVIEWKIEIVFDTFATNGSPIKGSLPSTVTVEGVIDGSSRAGKTTMTMKGTIDHRDMIGHEVGTTIEGTQEQTLTPVN
ncbi:MAG: hypothetical protein C0467_16245 [Planctomycetaceae bacterium]|nr:hypothetical protein [Planctomycetaceae bacterium]